MKIMQVNCVYKKGSTGKIVYDIHSYLKQKGYESVVCYGRGNNISEPNVYKSCHELYSRFNNLLSRFTGLMYGGCYFSTKKLIRIIEIEKPDIVHLHCINGYFVNIYRIITYLKNINIRTVLTLHAEFMYTANCGYALDCDKYLIGCGHCPRRRQETSSFFIDGTAASWKRMKRSFEDFERIIISSVSPWLQNRAKQSLILGGKKHTMILNGIDTSVFHYCFAQEAKKQLNLENKKVVFHVSSLFNDRIGHIKGGYYVLKMAERFFEIDSNVVFVVAGRYEEIENIPPNVILIGNVSDQNRLSEYYSMADVTLLTSKKETFSMVVAESLCCGTPVVGFEAGAPELITIKEFSVFVPQGDFEKLLTEIQKFLYNIAIDKKEISRIAELKYSKEIMGQNYLDLYNEILKY